ncbi:PREDICTED: photosystem II reaction center W protein, chloroplastic-like [Tarenaya hassleriana]|uniref:photosystem II reaction center W protein, chloroplastic-like n=1 Tax=Tarenaya hassleriana TaxID=28532 RepID=UPI00053C8C4A|nr:PREDICTED: photosystem II reaction center W protein, chloroplastic-like [Tarenaya hassleriana]
MASITATATSSAVSGAGLLLKPSSAASVAPVVGLSLKKGGKRSSGVRCSMEKKQPNSTAAGAGASAAAALLTAVMSSPAMALVDERMSTEGTGLPFGLSNNLLGWILFGVFGFIWAFYFIYASSLEEDEESGLSL